uniref:Uncharacterized protein n=1 Tax=Rubrivivax gelatinosus S1 TaxID=1138313 RepID=L8BAQ2_RUBGE|nr:hypothetical protein RGS1_10375 [Rubrivivax gelatinosus S1]
MQRALESVVDPHSGPLGVQSFSAQGLTLNCDKLLQTLKQRLSHAVTES